MANLSCSIPTDDYAYYFNKTQSLPANHNWQYVFDLKINRGYNSYNFTEQRYLRRNSAIRYLTDQQNDVQIAVDKSGSTFSDYFHQWNLIKISENTENWRFYFRILARINTGSINKTYISSGLFNVSIFVINSTAKFNMQIYVRNLQINQYSITSKASSLSTFSSKSGKIILIALMPFEFLFEI